MYFRGVEKKGIVISIFVVIFLYNLGLMSFVGGLGLKKGFRECGVDSGGILIYFFNNFLMLLLGSFLVGKVFVDVLIKVSKEVLDKELLCVELFCNLVKYFSEKEYGFNFILVKVKSFFFIFVMLFF